VASAGQQLKQHVADVMSSHFTQLQQQQQQQLEFASASVARLVNAGDS
jgi:hypothetical protein